MKFLFRRLFPILGLVIALIALATLVPVAMPSLVQAGEDDTSLAPAVDYEAASASLDNPSFEGSWYWFSYVPGAQESFVPTHWHIWFKNGTIPFYTRATSLHVDGDDAVRGHAYWSGEELKAGVYQVIDGTTPCLTYEFQMYGQSVADEGAWHHLSVGIHRTGYSPPNNSAVPGDYFDQIVWGASHSNCARKWCFTTVTAEAWADEITAFTYAHATGQTWHDIAWDAGDLKEVTPAQLIDPADPPSPGTLNPTVDAGSTSATVNWTSSAALGQVFYRLISGPSTPVTPTGTLLLYTIHLPFISSSPSPWLWTTLNKSSVTSHSELVSGLRPGSTYEYIVASRGVSGGECVTWISNKEEFTTDVTQ